MKLRISHMVVQAVLVWDDGKELTPGPDVQPISLPLSRLGAFAETVPAEIEALAEKLTAEADATPPN